MYDKQLRKISVKLWMKR